MPLKLEPRFSEGVYVIECTGRVVLGEEVSALQAALAKCAEACNQIVLGLGGVDRLDSIGLGLLVRYMTNLRKRGGDLRLADPPLFVLKLLEMTMLSSVLRTYSTEQGAIASFMSKLSQKSPQESKGPHVLVVDPSADLCVFVKTVLMQHGFNVQSATLLRDAKVLLQVGGFQFILVGPGTPQASSETIAQSLGILAPKAVILRLSTDFKDRTAEEAADSLLRMFGIARSPAQQS
ncbi:MAG TPA: STAS domain-containing protein [Acidobacteriaceae bacterium]|nr:STAS domain-containing protein [Acidobacteriaceae bacterium]